jgi:hypothetical protein
MSMDRRKHDGLPTVNEVCPDDAAVLALSVTRFIAAGYMTGDVACWDAAYDGAERVLGDVEAPAFVAAMIGLMRAIRSERADDWLFMPATCCRVTPHEEDLMALLGSARSAAGRGLSLETAQLAGVVNAPRLTGAARIAAELIQRAQRRLSIREAPSPGTAGRISPTHSTMQ